MCWKVPMPVAAMGWVLAEQAWCILAQCGAGLLEASSKCHLNLFVSDFEYL